MQDAATHRRVLTTHEQGGRENGNGRVSAAAPTGDRPEVADETFRVASAGARDGVLDGQSQVATMIAQHHRLSQQLQEVKHDRDALVEDIKHQVLLLREYVQTRRQRLRMTAQRRAAGPVEDGTADGSAQRAWPGLFEDAELGWVGTGDPRQGLAQALHLVESHHRELDRLQSMLERDLETGATREKGLSGELETTRRDLKHAIDANEQYRREIAAMQSQFEELCQRCASLEDSLQSANEQRQRLGAIVEGLEKENHQIELGREEVEKNLSGRIEELTQSLAQAQSDYNALRDEHLAWRQRFEELEAEHQATRRDLAEAGEEKHRLQETVAGWQRKHQLLTQERNEVEQRLTGSLETAQNVLQAVGEERDGYRQELRAREEDLETQRQEHAVSRQRLEAVHQEAGRLHEAITALTEDKRSLADARDRIERELSAGLQSTHAELQTTLAEREELQQQLSDVLERHRTTCEELGAEVKLREFAHARIESLEAGAAELEEEKTSLIQQRQRMERQLSETILQLRSELQEEQSHREKLQTEVEGLRERLSDARGDLAGQQKQLGKSQEESKDLLAKLTALEQQHRSLQAESRRVERELSDEVGELRRKLAQTSAQREGVQNELAALQKSHEQMQGQHQSSGESWQFALRSVRKEAQQMCEKSEQMQRQAEADLVDLRREQRGLADRYQKLELINQELTARGNDLKRRLAAAETLQRNTSAAGVPKSGTGDRTSSKLGYVFTKLGEQNKRSETKPPATAVSTRKASPKKEKQPAAPATTEPSETEQTSRVAENKQPKASTQAA